MNKQCIKHFLNGVYSMALVVLGMALSILWICFCGILINYLTEISANISMALSMIIHVLIIGGLMVAHTYGCFKRE